MTTPPADDIKAIIDSQPNWKGEALAKLRMAILAADPEISEVVKWRMPSKPLGSISFEKNGIVCVQDYLKAAVRLTFPKGAQIEDPAKLFNCRLDSKTTRGIDISEGEAMDLSSLQLLIRSAIEANSTSKEKR